MLSAAIAYQVLQQEKREIIHNAKSVLEKHRGLTSRLTRARRTSGERWLGFFVLAPRHFDGNLRR